MLKGIGLKFVKKYLAFPQRSLYCIQSSIKNILCSVPEMTRGLAEKQPCMVRELEGREGYN